MGFVLAGCVTGLLPYSQVDTATHLVHKEASSAPGFLHGLDVTILAGLLVTFGMLLVALRRRGDHDAPASDWIEHQFEDE